MLEIFFPLFLYLENLSRLMNLKSETEVYVPFENYMTKEDIDKTESKLIIHHTISEVRDALISLNYRKANEGMDTLKKYSDYPEAKANLLYFEAVIESRNNNHMKAINLLKLSVEIDPYIDAAWNLLGYLYSFTGYPDEAIQKFLRAIQLEPYTPTYHYNLAYSYWLKNDLENALLSVNRSLELRDNMGEAYYLKGMILEKLSNKTEALQNFQIALERNYSTIPFLIHFMNLAYEEQHTQYLQLLLDKTENNFYPDILKMRLLIQLSYGEYNKAFNTFIILLKNNLLESLIHSQFSRDKELIEKIQVFKCTHKKGIMEYLSIKKNISEKEKEFLQKIIDESCNQRIFSRDPIVNPVQ